MISKRGPIDALWCALTAEPAAGRKHQCKGDGDKPGLPS